MLWGLQDGPFGQFRTINARYLSIRLINCCKLVEVSLLAIFGLTINIVSDTKTFFLRCIPFISKVQKGEIYFLRDSTIIYNNLLQFYSIQKLLKNSSFHSNKIELRDSTCEKIPFVSVGITRVVLLFHKFRIIIFDLSCIQDGCSKIS